MYDRNCGIDIGSFSRHDCDGLNSPSAVLQLNDIGLVYMRWGLDEVVGYILDVNRKALANKTHKFTK